MYIEKINSPANLKNLTIPELSLLSDEVRTLLLRKVSEHGGHIAPNLGVVEATVAMHYVFNSPIDKFVFDVSHQSYPHKILTGRKIAFSEAAHYDDVSGYTNPDESEHDFFTIGHTSTSISLACGLAKARDLKGEKENIIAVIGDGSLSGGEAFEGLNNAAESNSNLIIVVNDNQMSIAENHGGLYRNLKELRDTNGESPCNFFKAMGLEYLYVSKGNDIASLIEAFKKVKDTTSPTVVHINTLKGKGYSFAEQDKESFHWGMPFDLDTGKPLDNDDEDDYATLSAKHLLKRMKEDKTIVAITSGTPGGIGFTPDLRAEAGSQFIDVGIAEEHAVALASSIAAGGGKPVYGVFSTFIQRSYDQLSQDLCINNNPAVINIFAASLTGMNDVTHLGFFDIPLISNIPNMVYLAPTCKEEYFAMLDWGINQDSHPVAIRVPANGIINSSHPCDIDYSHLNTYQVTRQGSGVAIIALGSFYQLGEQVVAMLQENHGINATLVNPRFISGIDEKLLSSLSHSHSLVVTLEDGILDGGFGEKITRFYGTSPMKVMNFGAKKKFVDRFDRVTFLKDNHLTATQIEHDIIANL